MSLFTEPFPAAISITSLLIPLVFWMGVLLVAHEPGIVVWCLLSKVILDGGQLVFLYFFRQSVIAIDTYLDLTDSNASEASKLSGNIILVIGCILFFYALPALILAYHSVRQKERLRNPFRRKWAEISLDMFIIGLILCFLPPLQDHRFSWKDDVYPAGTLYSLYSAISRAERNRRYHITSANFKFDATKLEQTEGEREIYILVVGETSHAMEWSLYGHERKTTPRMEALDELVYFTDVMTQSNDTHKNVPIILPATSAENYGVLCDEKSIVTVSRRADFRTFTIVNQELTTSMIGAFYRGVNTFIDVSAFGTGSVLVSLRDAAVLPYLEKKLGKEGGNLPVILHTYDSHFNYHERYPREFRFYRPGKAKGTRTSYKEELQNAYNNFIHYTGYVLGETVDMLTRTNAPTPMPYLSDHGEDIFDDSRARYLHASPISTCYQLYVPYVTWLSKAYRESYPQKHPEAQAHGTYPASTNGVLHTMLDIAGVRTPVADSAFTLTNRTSEVHDCIYLGDHGDPVPSWRVGLKEQDFEMMDK